MCSNDPAPDANGNFGVLDDADAPPLNVADRIVFEAKFVNTFGPNDTTGIVLDDPTPPETRTLLLRQGQSVEGVPVGTLGNPPPAFNSTGMTLITCPSCQAVLLDLGGTNAVAVQSGQAMPDGGNVGFPILPPAINDAGQIALASYATGAPGVYAAFLRDDFGTLVEPVRHGDFVPDHNGTFDLVSTLAALRAPALNEKGELAFVVAIAGASGPGTQALVRASDRVDVVTIARRGDPTPDSDGSFLGLDVDAGTTVALNDAGQAAFKATLGGTSQGTADDTGIFRGDGITPLRVVREGMTAPGGDGTFATFDPPAVDAGGQVAFHATLAGTANTQGIFLYDDVDGLIAVVRTGDVILGRHVVSVRFQPDTDRGRKHLGLDDAGQVAFQFDLDDGRRGVAVWTPDAATTTTTTIATTTSGPTTSTIAGASSTSTTIAGASTSTTFGSTTTTPGASSTTTTLARCATVRCLVYGATGAAPCAGQTIRAAVVRKLDRAVTKAEQASLQTSKKRPRFYKSAKQLLGEAAKAAVKATRGRHPKLTTDCATTLVDAIHEATTLVDAALTPGATR